MSDDDMPGLDSHDVFPNSSPEASDYLNNL